MHIHIKYVYNIIKQLSRMKRINYTKQVLKSDNYESGQ